MISPNGGSKKTNPGFPINFPTYDWITTRRTEQPGLCSVLHVCVAPAPLALACRGRRDVCYIDIHRYIVSTTQSRSRAGNSIFLQRFHVAFTVVVRTCRLLWSIAGIRMVVLMSFAMPSKRRPHEQFLPIFGRDYGSEELTARQYSTPLEPGKLYFQSSSMRVS
jgi:hypothetical protein